MGRFIEGEDLEEVFGVVKDCHCLKFFVDPWENSMEEFCMPTTKDYMSILQKKEADLFLLAVDMLDDIREDLDDALSKIYDFQPGFNKVKKVGIKT